MGIPTFFRNIVSKHPDVIIGSEPGKLLVHRLFLDYNGIVYKALPKVLKKFANSNPSVTVFEKDLIKEVISYTQHLIANVVQPQKMVYIAFDGPAPRAKMVQQRSRRYKSIILSDFQKKMKDKYKIINSSFSWDGSPNVSPGTPFMAKLYDELLKIIKEHKFTPYNENVQIVFSDSNYPGEGEHKIMPVIRELNKENETKNETFAIYSSDADLIVLSMLTHKNNIFIVREPERDEKKFENFDFIYFNNDLCRGYFYNQIKGEYNKHVDEYRIINDYMFLTFFVGNDFVSSMYFLKIRSRVANSDGLSKILNIYKKIRNETDEYLIDYDINTKPNPEINNKFLMEIFYHLGQNESDYLAKQQVEMNKIMNGFRSQRTIESEKHKSPYEIEMSRYEHTEMCSPYHPLYGEYKNDFKAINYLEDKTIWEPKYYEKFFDLNSKNEKEYNQGRVNVVINYLESLIFTLKYYLNGIPPSWTWHYKYRGAPLPSDVYAVLYYKKFNINSIRFKQGTPYTPFQQLMLIMPKKLLNLLPSGFEKIIDDNEEIAKFYPNTDTIRLDAAQGIKYIYSEAILPEIETDILMKSVKEVESKLKPSDKKRNVIRKKILIL